MSQIKTYIFGNPAGWALYEGDSNEIDYFKGFYISSRKGARLMVNRREDGSTAYTYINYDMQEASDRRGDAHFGMAFILPGGRYTSEFNTIFRFMDTLYHKAMEQPSPIYAMDAEGLIRYRVNKLDEAADTIEWIKKTIPRIFDRLELKNWSYDDSFCDGTSGVIPRYADSETDEEVTDEVVLDGFRHNNWIAISPAFKRDTAGQAETEVSLSDLIRKHMSLSNRLLAAATNATPISLEELDDINSQVGNARKTLSEYIKTQPADMAEAINCQRQFFELYPAIDKIKLAVQKSGQSKSSLRKDNYVEANTQEHDAGAPQLDQHDSAVPGFSATVRKQQIHRNDNGTGFLSRISLPVLSGILGATLFIIFGLFIMLSKGCNSNSGNETDLTPKLEELRGTFWALLDSCDIDGTLVFVENNKEHIKDIANGLPFETVVLKLNSLKVLIAKDHLESNEYKTGLELISTLGGDINGKLGQVLSDKATKRNPTDPVSLYICVNGDTIRDERYTIRKDGTYTFSSNGGKIWFDQQPNGMNMTKGDNDRTLTVKRGQKYSVTLKYGNKDHKDDLSSYKTLTVYVDTQTNNGGTPPPKDNINNLLLTIQK